MSVCGFLGLVALLAGTVLAAEPSGTTLCDLHEAFIGYLKQHNPEDKDRGILTTDGVHLNPAGNRFVADCAAEAIIAARKK